MDADTDGSGCGVVGPCNIIQVRETRSTQCNSVPEDEEVPTHMLLFDVMLLKNPAAHASHLGSEVTEPAVLVNLPGGHLVWAVQTSALLLEAKAWKNPVAHVSHSTCVATDPAFFVYFPGPHSA